MHTRMRLTASRRAAGLRKHTVQRVQNEITRRRKQNEVVYLEFCAKLHWPKCGEDAHGYRECKSVWMRRRDHLMVSKSNSAQTSTELTATNITRDRS